MRLIVVGTSPYACLSITRRAGISIADFKIVMRESLRGSVLVVDDDPDVSSVMALLLQEFCWETEIAHDGFEALQCLERRQFDLVISDYYMPTMSGLVLARQIRERFPEQRIFLLTGFAAELEGRSLPFIDRLLTKPISMRDLQAAVEADFKQA